QPFVTTSTAVDHEAYDKAGCTLCGGKIEFPANAGGMTVECPHCHRQTELQPLKRVSRNISKLLIFTIVGIAATVAALVFLKIGKPAKTMDPSAFSPVSNAAPVAAEPPRPKSLADLKL